MRLTEWKMMSLFRLILDMYQIYKMNDEWLEQPKAKGGHMLTVLPERYPQSHSHSTVRG